jgi:hypothetical protein
MYVSLLTTALTARAGDLAFSDPANVTPAPAWAIGQAHRAPDLDVLPGFQQPPPGFGNVPFFWWLGDPLTQERLGWILDQMAGIGISGYQINYAHSDKGGRSFGFTYPSDPVLFSEDWWKITGWFMQASKQQGAAISLSDYTLGFGQGWCVDEILREHPEVNGMVLRMDTAGKVTPQTVPWSLNPLHPQSGQWYAEKFFGQFERRFPGEGGKGLNFFFSDELGFGVSGHLWSANFAEEFKKRKGYDITPELPALFKDLGPRTPKIRLDYRDVLVALSEEGFFKPVFDWHQQRGMIMGCDHGGRGRDVVEFGDYFRTQRWNQGPGADQPGLGKNLIKAKVAASIAHLYERPRVWLEGFYSSGWGTTSAGVVDATFANFVMGFNLLSFHGMYYATHGGWWEWAPPDNTFRMPYWQHLRGFMDCVQRLSYLLTQGHHRCDVAILYPVAPMEAGMDGKLAVSTAFSTGEELYGKGIDFDFMDFESLDRAQIVGQELRVSGESYRVLVLPAMKAIRHSTLTKAVAFHRAGGTVLALGALPEASDRVGRDDPEVAAMSKEIGLTADVFARLPPRDYAGPGNIQHRKLGPRDLYAIYGAPQGSLCKFRATGRAELWDPWTGATRPLEVIAQSNGVTELALPLTEKEIQLIVFSPGKPVISAKSEISNLKSQISLDGDWEFEVQPTCDNRYGDFHWPPTAKFIGAEARRFRYADETTANPGWQDPKSDDSTWKIVTASYGPQFWKLGPLPTSANADAELAALKQVDPAVPVKIGGRTYRWQPYEFSWQWGIEGNPGHQGYHGLKENITDDFIGLGGPARAKNETAFGPEAGGTRYYLWTSVPASADRKAQALAGAIKPAAAWLNHAPLAKNGTVQLHAGANPLLLRYDKPGRTFFVVGNAKTPAEDVVEAGAATATPVAGEAPFSPAANWIWFGSETGERCFQKSFTLDKVPAKAILRATADDSYTARLNGAKVGAGTSWQRVQEFEVTAQLQAGANTLEMVGRNGGGQAGVIAELTLTDVHGASTRIVTDSSWLAAAGQTLKTGAKQAEQISAFAGSLWATHPQGPPQLEKQSAAPQNLPRQIAAISPTEHTGTLAMSWHHNSDFLPFDTRPQTAQPAGWYRFVAPPGLRAMTLTARGKVQAWADGKECRVSRGEGREPLRVELPTPAEGCVVVALRIEQERGCYGGAALPEFIQLDCGPGKFAAGDWSKNDGLAAYSGGAWYRKSVTHTAEQLKGAVTLDLGAVAASAEVRINGQPAGIKVAPPWTLDVTKLLKPGENKIEILVCNTLANHYLTVPTRYRGSPVSGLLGPVVLKFSTLR